uniref:NADH dehydrogenase subunit 4L n=1 Tax=Eustenogaster scitula TaxID=1980568 RepID=A0A509ZVR3_9HYME|nr:NADH dehydrogenase subunit 4L [Eustenogaster scitula]ARO89847.1 NADH dehydrogenase subunit 4L [Eustenogaster scitula]
MYVYKWNYFLLNLMIMEFIVLIMILLMSMILQKMSLEIYIIYFLVFSVSESILGLTMIIYMIRYSGNNMNMFINLLY